MGTRSPSKRTISSSTILTSCWPGLRLSVRDSNTLGPLQSELALVVVEVGGGPAHDVVDGGARDTLALRDLAVGPVELPREVQDTALMVGQQQPVEVEEPQLPLAASGTVKHLALTV